jgi:hypothetical protein
MQDTPSPNPLVQHHVRIWNSLIPKHALHAHVIPNVGVRWLHPTKGWRITGKRRFAARGVR